jgi:hypothetical protein
VRRLGVDFLHALNGGLAAPRWQGTQLAFAAGGAVPVVTTASAAQASVRIVNVLDPSLVAGYLATASGERAVLNVIERNPGLIRSVIG